MIGLNPKTIDPCADLDQQLATARTHEEIMTIMVGLFAAAGFNSFCYTLQAPERYQRPPAVLYWNFSPDWFAHYMQSGFMETDPILAYYRNNSRPWFWSVDDDWSSYGPAVLSFMAELKNWGFTRGVVLPHYTAHLFRGFCNLGLEGSLDNLAERMAKIVLALPYFHHNVKRVYLEQNPKSCLHAVLTKRERQVFQLVADGLTSQEIAEQLNVAKATVEKYITSVQEKLQAGNRQQALCKAVSFGLILPTDYYPDVDEMVHLVMV